MRIVYLVSLFPCWSETFIVREIRQLKAAGAQVGIVSLKHPSEAMVQPDAKALLPDVVYPARGARALGAALVELARGGLPLLRTILAILWGLRRDPEAAAKTAVVVLRTLSVAGRIRALEPDHLHAHWATYPSTAALLLSRLLDRPFSFTSHAHDIFVNDQLIGDKLRAARFAVTISEYNVRHLRSVAPESADAPLRVIHCGVLLDEHAFVSSGRDPRLLLAVGRLDEIKGFRYLVDACRRLAEAGEAFECRIVGDGPLRGELQARIESAGLADRVRLLGAKPQDEVRALIRAAGVFVLPCVVARSGDRDGIPVALMEAMASGLPVVSTRVSGVPELVEHESTGLLAEPEDADGLASQVARLLHDGALASRLAIAARRKVEAEYDARREADKLLAEIRAAAGEAAPR